jgi:Ca2+/H+ antiporter
MYVTKSDFHPSAPTMEDIELDEPEIAVAAAVPTAVPVYYNSNSNARPPATAEAFPIPAPTALPAHHAHSPCCAAATATAPGINVPVVTATSTPQFTVSNGDYAKNMRLYSTQRRNRRVAVCILMSGLFVVVLVVGIVVATRQRDAYHSWDDGH